MKHSFSLLLMLLAFSTASVCAQQIAVVNGAGTTLVFYDLDKAIEQAENGSTVYLPGGGFTVSALTNITKKLTLIGTGHKLTADNPDGNTTIIGNVNFASGSDGSAIMGVYMPNDIVIGNDGKVCNILVRYCNANSIQVKSDSCTGLYVNQNYLRGNCSFHQSNVTMTNNIVNGIKDINGGLLKNNIIYDQCCRIGYYSYTYYSFDNVSNSSITNNISRYGFYNCNGNLYKDNIENSNLTDIFIKPDGINTTSDFHFNSLFDGNRECGIYAGTGFSDDCLPPLPRIVSKSIAEQTDAQGKLKVQVTVKTR